MERSQTLLERLKEHVKDSNAAIYTSHDKDKISKYSAGYIAGQENLLNMIEFYINSGYKL